MPELSKRPSLEVVDIFHLHGEEYKNHYPLSPEQRKAIADMTRCRTAGLGGNKVVKVHFVEYVGRRKKKVTHIEVTNAELDEMIKNPDSKAVAQFAMF